MNDYEALAATMFWAGVTGLIITYHMSKYYKEVYRTNKKNSYGYSFAEFAITSTAEYSIGNTPKGDEWIATVLDKKYDNQRREVFDNKADAKAYCEQVKIERNE